MSEGHHDDTSLGRGMNQIKLVYACAVPQSGHYVPHSSLQCIKPGARYSAGLGLE